MGGQFADLCKVACEVQADIVACQEHNIDLSQPAAKSILLYDTVRREWTRARLSLGSSPIPYNTLYKPGGTLLAVRDHMTGRVIASDSDKWGRWTSVTLRGRKDSSITIVSAPYQVNPDSPCSGQNTAAAQQRSLMLTVQDPLTYPRAAFVRDLSEYLRMLRQRGDEILLLGDFNETLGGRQSPLTDALSELNLVQLMSSKHPSPLPASYTRGKSVWILDSRLIAYRCPCYAVDTRRSARVLPPTIDHVFSTLTRLYFSARPLPRCQTRHIVCCMPTTLSN